MGRFEMNHTACRLIVLVLLCFIPIVGPPFAIFMIMGLSTSSPWLLCAFLAECAITIYTFGFSGIWTGFFGNISNGNFLSVDFFLHSGISYFAGVLLALVVVYMNNSNKGGFTSDRSILSISKRIPRRSARRQRQGQEEVMELGHEDPDERSHLEAVRARRAEAAETKRAAGRW